MKFRIWGKSAHVARFYPLMTGVPHSYQQAEYAKKEIFGQEIESNLQNRHFCLQTRPDGIWQ